jgi:hypothetical protein
MPRLFLPFTAAGKKTEMRAIEAKEILGLGPYDPVDPYTVLDRVPARLLDSSILEHCPDSSRRTLLESHPDEWSGVGYGRVGADGEALILLNPTHHPHRQKVTLMEEILHVIFNHPMTELTFGAKPFARSFDSAVEKEAYGVGAACIIPYRSLFRLVNDEHRTSREISELFGVSRDYCEFRIKDAGLYRVYKKHCV